MDKRSSEASAHLKWLALGFPDDFQEWNAVDMKASFNKTCEYLQRIVTRVEREEHEALSKITTPCMCKLCRAKRAVEKESVATVITTNGNVQIRKNWCIRIAEWWNGTKQD